LELGLMSARNGSRHETAFTVSIEAREGISTGISVADRAHTIAVAIDADKGRDHLVTPGHVFPLVARDGGVLVRAGHTEAAVDVARLAGLNPSGVICEIMDDNGKMARLDALSDFASRHGLKIGTIRDLISYRLRHDRLVERRAEMTFDSCWGDRWNAVAFLNRITHEEHMVLTKGEIRRNEPTLVRMHQLSWFTDTLGEKSERSGLLAKSMQIIGASGAGVVVSLNRPRRDALSRVMNARSGAEISPTKTNELRDYGIGAQILSDLGVGDIILLSDQAKIPMGLAGYGLSIVGHHPIERKALL
jgi:3,4-dihydroxy 2-butanone 4-phosphate synthase/GTP cyclohydrolase II